MAAVPTVEPVLAEQVGTAYQAYWRVRSQALLELDPSHLSEVMDGEYLANFQSRLNDLQTQNRAIRTQVNLNYTVVQANSLQAIVQDRVEDESFYIVPGTLDPITQPAKDLTFIEFKFQSIEGIWKVVDSVRAV
jgi:hypothetical protein